MANLQAERMKKTIQEALLKLLATEPFESITIQQIADAALIHRTTFYAHYEDKYALLDVILQSQSDAEPATADDLRVRPFASLAKLCQGQLAPVVVKQRNDQDFQTAMLRIFLGRMKKTDNSANLADYMLIGRIKAVMHWVRETNQPFNIYTAGTELDKLMVNANKQIDNSPLA